LFLGTAAACPTKERNVSAYAIKTMLARHWLVGCGEGTQHRIVARTDLIKTSRLDVILITHLHGDHSFGLPGLLASISMGNAEPDRKLKLIGPVGLQTMVKTALKLSETYLTYELDIVELEDNKVHDLGSLGEMSVKAFPLTHKVPCFGYLISEPDKLGKLDGKKAAKLGAKGGQLGELKDGKDVTLADGTVIKAADVCFAPTKGKMLLALGDTSNSESVVPFATNCDVVIHESTFDATLQKKAVDGGHSTSAMAGTFAKTISAKKLIITHFSKRYFEGEDGPHIPDLVREAQQECPGTVVLAAEDYASFSVKD